MTTITLEVPDELANRLAPHQDRLPAILSLALELLPLDDETLSHSTEPDSLQPILKDVIDFLMSRPTPTQIVGFKFSMVAQARLEALLDKNREDELTVEEVAELDTYQQINHLLILLKAQARSTLAPANNLTDGPYPHSG